MAASPLRAEMSGTSVRPATPGPTRLVVRVDPRSGRLVRAVAASTPKPPSKQRQQYATLVQQASKTHNVDPLLVDSVIQVESNYNPYAVSSKGAEGLMQLMPSTARMLGVRNSFDPQENIEAGVRYLKQLKEKFQDDRLALAAYNAGPKAVEKYKWIPPYAETQSYVSEIGKRYSEAKQVATPAKPAGKPEPPQAAIAQGKVEETHPKLEQYVDPDGRLHLSTKTRP